MQDADNLVSVKVDKIDTNTDSVVPKGLEIGDDGVLAVKVAKTNSVSRGLEIDSDGVLAVNPGYGLEITDDGCLAVKLSMINTAVAAQLDILLGNTE